MVIQCPEKKRRVRDFAEVLVDAFAAKLQRRPIFRDGWVLAEFIQNEDFKFFARWRSESKDGLVKQFFISRVQYLPQSVVDWRWDRYRGFVPRTVIRPPVPSAREVRARIRAKEASK